MRTVRRKIRWGRLSIVLILLILVIVFVAWTGIQLYRTLSLPKATTEKISTPWKESTHFVFVGLDAGEVVEGEVLRQADTILIFSIYPVEKRVQFLFLPRNTKVSISGYNKGYGTLTDSYKVGGMGLLTKKIEELLNIPLHYYVTVEINSFVRLIDWLGGVDYYVEKDMHHEDGKSNLNIHLLKGYQHLDGKKLSDYVRFRNDDFDELGRVQRQQRLVRTLMHEKLEYRTILLLPYLQDSLATYIQTDMTTIDLMRLINSVRQINIKNAEIVTLSGKLVNQNGISFWIPDIASKSTN